MYGTLMIPAMLEMLMMAPERCCLNTGDTTCMHSMAPKRLVSNMRRQAAMSMRSTESTRPNPALFTQTSTRPKRSIGRRQQGFDLRPHAHIAGYGEGALRRSGALPRGLHAAKIARGQHHRRTFAEKAMDDGLADPHRRAGDDDNFSRNAHAELLLRAAG